jgi:hypothetical protein
VKYRKDNETDEQHDDKKRCYGSIPRGAKSVTDFRSQSLKRITPRRRLAMLFFNAGGSDAFGI